MIHYVTRATRHFVFWTLILAAVLLSSLRLALIGVDRYKTNLEDRIGGLIGSPVRIHKIGAKIRGLSPELILDHVDIDVAPSTGKPAIHLDQIRFGVDLGELLMKRELLSSSWVDLVGAHLLIYRDNTGKFAIQGLDSGEGQPLWLLQGRRYKVLQSRIEFIDFFKDAEPFKLDDVNIAVLNDGHRHRIHLITQLPKPYGDYFKAAIDFNGSPERLDQLTGRGYVEGHQIALPEKIADYLPAAVRLQAKGTADFKLWSAWREAQPVSVEGDIRLYNTTLKPLNRPSLSIKNLQTQFHWQARENAWELAVNRFLMESQNGNNQPGKKWPDLIFRAGLAKTGEPGKAAFKLNVKQADLALVSMFAALYSPMSETQITLLNRAKIKGSLNDVKLYVGPNAETYAVSGRFDSFGADPVTTDEGVFIPGMTNISGHVSGIETGGAIRLASRQVNITANKLFQQSLAFDRLEGNVIWRQHGDAWSLASDSLTMECAAFIADNRFHIDFSAGESDPFIDWQTVFKSDRLAQVAGYLPTQVMSERLRSWLAGAFVSGKVAKGNLLFYGNPAAFPFDDNSGVFEATADLDDVELNFNPQWPHFSKIHGQLRYEHSAISGLFDRGMMGNVEVTGTEMSIPALGSHQEHLLIKGKAQGDINEVLKVLQQSPIADRVDTFVAGTTVRGSTNGALELMVPLWPGQDIKLDGYAQFDNAELTVVRADLTVKKIVGAIKFNMSGIYSEPIQASALGHPVTATVSQTDEETLISVNGVTGVSDIERLFDWPHAAFAQGEGAYRLDLHLPNTFANQRQARVDIMSTLEGFDLILPGTLAKTAVQKKPSSLTLVFEDESVMPIDLNYNNELKAMLSFDPALRKINGGHIVVGRGKALRRQASGIKFEIDKKQLPLQEWLVVAANGEQDWGSLLAVDEIRLQSESAYWKKTSLGPFDLTLLRQPDRWTGEIASSVAKGKFQIPQSLTGGQPIVMEMDMLNLSVLKQFKMQAAIQSASSALQPLLQLQSKKNLWQSANLGRLLLTTSRTQEGIAIKRLELDGPDEKLVSTGMWRDNGITSATQIKGTLEIKKADRFFDKLNITKDLTETRGTIAFNLNWPDQPWQLALPDLSGNLEVNLDGGRILSIEPGFGRLLGILAVEQWLRRLQLDFTDIYQEGLTFNSIKGHFELKNGKASTDNLIIDAIPAMITLSGVTDLNRQTVDHIIKVVPKSSDAVPIAGTIVGELAALVGKSLTGKNQEGFFFGTQYEVKGSWEDAKISSLHENDGIFQKTWNSITDFSWLEPKSRNDKK